MNLIAVVFVWAAAFLSLGTTSAAEASAQVRKIVLIAGKKNHGPGDHEYEKGVVLLKKCLDTSADSNSLSR